MLLDIPATLQISTHVLAGRVAGLSRKSNMDIGWNPTARYLSCCQHIADMSASDMLWHVGPVSLPTAVCDMSPTCRPTCLQHVGLTDTCLLFWPSFQHANIQLCQQSGWVRAKRGIWSKRVFMRTNGNFSFSVHLKEYYEYSLISTGVVHA
jgi:hypothetical protein